MSDIAKTPWKRYWSRFWPRFKADWKQAVKTQLLVGLLLSVGTVVLQVRWGLITAPTVKANLFVVLAPYFLFTVVFAFYHIVNTVKSIHEEDWGRIKLLEDQLTETANALVISTTDPKCEENIFETDGTKMRPAKILRVLLRNDTKADINGVLYYIKIAKLNGEIMDEGDSPLHWSDELLDPFGPKTIPRNGGRLWVAMCLTAEFYSWMRLYTQKASFGYHIFHEPNTYAITCRFSGSMQQVFTVYVKYDGNWESLKFAPT